MSNDAEQEWRKQRLIDASAKAGGDAELGRMLGHKSGAQVGHMSYGRRPITEKTVAKVEALRGFAGWFSRQAAPPPVSLRDGDPEYAGEVELRLVPVVGTAKMGDDGYYDEISSVPGAGDGHIEIATRDANAYGLRVKGQSMFPAIRDGWYVLIEPNGTPKEGEYVLVKLNDGRKMVKEFLYRRIGSIELMSVNGDERITIEAADLQDMQAVGAVVSPSKWKPD